MNYKVELTKQLVNQLPEAKRISPESARIAWWFNLRPNGGLRLTKMGYEALAHQIELAHYEYNVEPLIITSKMIIALDRKLQQPWYLYTVKMMPRTLVFFGSKEAMMANLYGDLKKFLDNYS